MHKSTGNIHFPINSSEVYLTVICMFTTYDNQTIGFVGPLLSLTKTERTNSIFRQRQSFILRAATAQLYLSATLLIYHVGLSVIPSVLSNLLTIQLSKAAMASVRHPNDFQSRQTPLIISAQEHSLVPGLLFCLKGRRQAGRLYTGQKKLSFQPDIYLIRPRKH